jgi:hypothetical protein
MKNPPTQERRRKENIDSKILRGQVVISSHW